MATSTTHVHTTPYLNDASKVLPIRVDCSSPEDHSCKEQITGVVTALCPFFMKKDFQISKLTGGLSNFMFVVKNGDKHEVLVRIQSSSEDSLVDVEEENRICAWLSSQDKAPLFYGRFANGRVEEFYSGYAPLKSSDMPNYASQIATLMASLHSSAPPTNVVPRCTTSTSNNKGQYWTTIQSWLNLAKSQQSQSKHAFNLEYLQHQFDWLQRQLTTQECNKVTRYCRQVVFCHMDAQSLNLLKSPATNELKLIDYEYAGWNARAADIANTFCEHCDMNNLRANYTTQYPSPSQQDTFLQAYWSAMGDEELFEQDDYHKFHVEIGKHTLISHLGWVVWSIVQSELSDIEFDYLAYARQRMEGYEYFKTKYYTQDEINCS